VEVLQEFDDDDNRENKSKMLAKKVMIKNKIEKEIIVISSESASLDDFEESSDFFQRDAQVFKSEKEDRETVKEDDSNTWKTIKTPDGKNKKVFMPGGKMMGGSVGYLAWKKQKNK